MLENSGYSLNNTSTGDASRQAQPANDQEEEPIETDDNDSEEYISNPGSFFKGGPVAKTTSGSAPEAKRQQSLVQLGRTPVLSLHPL